MYIHYAITKVIVSIYIGNDIVGCVNAVVL